MAMEMQCSGCGKRIPFAGNVCPYCHRDKTDDQQNEVEIQFVSFVGAVMALIVGVIVYQFASFKTTLIAGGIVAVLVMGFAYWVVKQGKP